MSRLQTSSADQRPAGKAERQRGREARAPRARTPEPKEIITGAGQPLDLGLRRELEERLGHDFSRVRVHTDPDAALLTDLLGADAVTVGEDVFFAEGRFRPGTEDGRRLVAHELLHTVQAPHPLGALKAGRDLGAVSMPQDAVERQAEDGARSDLPRPGVTRNATPGWLRYARVSADRFRTELLDPATLVDRLTAGIVRSLRGDPTDATGRVRQQLTRFAPELKESVLDRLTLRLPSSDHERLLELVERSERGPAEADAGTVPGPVAEPSRDPGGEAEGGPGTPPKGQEGEAGGGAPKPGEKDPEGEAPGAKGSAGKDGETPEGKGEEPGKESQEGKGEEQDKESPEEKGKEPGEESERTKEKPPPTEEKEPGAEPGKPEAGGQPERAAAETGAVAAVVGAAPGAASPGGAAAQALGAPEQQRKALRNGPAAGARPAVVGARVDQQPGPARPERVDRRAEAEDSPLGRHGLLGGKEGKGEQADEPLGLAPGADKEVEVPKDEGPETTGPIGPELRPDDYLPDTDLDVSSVPTADHLDPAAEGTAVQEAPSFPAPPKTKADEILRQREQEEGEAAAEEPSRPPAAPRAVDGPPAPAATEAPAPPGAGREPESDTAPEPRSDEPVEREIGPDPAAAQAEAGRPDPGADREEAPEPSYAGASGRPDLAQGMGTGPEADRGRPAAATAERAYPVTGAGPGAPGTTGTPGPEGTEATGPLGSPGPVAEQTDAPGGLGASGAQSAPDASMEKGGGACAAVRQPTTEGEKPEGGGGGCEGGGAAAGGKEEAPEQQPAPPDVSGQDPQSALATAGTLPPDRMAATLDGVDGAVDRSVGEQHAALEADAPTAQRPSGAPGTLSGTPEEAAPAQQVTEHVEREGAESGKEQKKAEGEKAGGPNPAADVPRPAVSDDQANQVSAQDVQNVQNAVGEAPVTDASLNRTVKAPKVQLSGESDPGRTDRQAGNLKTSSAKILGVGREDAAKPMGEDRIYPDVPGETLRGDVPGSAGGAGGRRRAGAVAATGPGVAAVAQQERGPQIQAAVGQGQGRMGQEQARHKQSEAEERRSSQEARDRAVAENAEAQAGERGQAAEQVRAERTQWQAEQDQEITRADTDAVKEHGEKNKEIDTKRTDTDKDVGKRQDEDNKKIQDNRKEAEEKARKEKERKKEESSGWWGWVKSKVKAAFDALLSAITGIFDFFRKIVNGIIDKFREFANWAIEQARKLAVELIKKLADALIAIGDVLLAAFPGLRDKFRNKIRQWRDQAIAKVNEWADKLKAAVNKLLDLLAAGLNALLGLLEKVLKAVVDQVRESVLAAIEFARNAIAMLGELAELVVDVAADPGGWVVKLGRSAKEGIQNHLWGAVKRAVKGWFNEKVESVLGLGKKVVDVLLKGCYTMAEIGRMAWEALIESLPGIIISMVVERVISMITFPAGAAIIEIVRGAIAVWGTINKIIAAFGKFFRFLKAVKSGAAACLFAEALASGVVVLLELITNYLLARLKSAAKSVGTRLKAIAQKIMEGLAKAAKGPRLAAGGAINRLKDGLNRGAQALGLTPRPGAKPGPRPGPAPGRPSGKATPPKGRPATSKPARPGPSMGARALTGVKTTVKNSVRKVTGAVRALGGKLRNSKLGNVLVKGAQKLREGYGKLRDKARERWAKWQKARQERAAHENSPAGKAARLAKIVARIRPKLAKLLRRGLPGAALRGVLWGMRQWYGLSGLVASAGRQFAVTATLNPEQQAGSGFRLTGEDLRKLVHEVAKEILDRQEIKDAAQRLRLTKARGGKGHPLETTGAQDIPATVRYLRERGNSLDVSRPDGGTLEVGPHVSRWGTVDSYRVGSDHAVVKEQQKAGQLNQITLGVGTYPEIAASLQATGLSDKRVASVLRAFHKTGRFPGSLTAEQEAMFRNLHWLMFVRESVRNPANLGFAAMTLDLVHRGPGQGGLTVHEAFAQHENTGRQGGRGSFPMSMVNAVRATRGVEAEEAGLPTGKTHQGGTRAERAELRKREVEMAEQWALAVTGGQGVLGETAEEAISAGRKLISDFMLKFHGLHENERGI
ncbi:eCIS core domain-containing protein [Streptomyces eurocidicus]|uniref:eCIS core domain-containing protein n=1 Tax=Streptomyces eurocidicus TaxID=66423 RepID=A0A7W8F5E7_STREU|nr:DUF4157 domain-containing protein [Streptomyces eurocidicus]MBB5122014.1 hypothetical protein [Streptomyces eurocidicus]MBF6055349.1 DUF4157 domain-containing protein [Streptomyces eurocidicus]